MDSPRRKTGHPSGSAARARFSAAPVSSAWLAKSGQKALPRQTDDRGSKYDLVVLLAP